MDPVTQGVLGASAAQAVSNRKTIAVASLLGVMGGMAPDLDILIRSAEDPLLALEYHRQFTHSFVFIPIGAFLVALAAHLLFARRVLSFKQSYVFSLAGYATHALLDACTTYGTLLLWPFSDLRVAWNVVSVVDPLFTIPALLLVILAWRKKTKTWSYIALAWMVVYLSFGVLQHDRAMQAARSVIEARGHEPLNHGVKPSFANLLLWKSVYEHKGRYYVDAVRVASELQVLLGTSTAKLSLEQQFPWLQLDSQQAKDVQRFAWFSNQHLGLDPNNSDRIIDIRYSLIPNQLTGMWGIELDQTAAKNAHARYTTSRTQAGDMNALLAELWSMIVGTHSDLKTIHEWNDKAE